jgi:hypothetical protein
MIGVSLWSDAGPSWTWPGQEGETAAVEVYADAEVVELTYRGRALPAVQPTEPGQIKVNVAADGCEPVAVTITSRGVAP